jgi:hypothetical protein
MSESTKSHNRPPRFTHLRRTLGTAFLCLAGVGAVFTNQHSVTTIAHQAPEASTLTQVKHQEEQVSRQAIRQHPDPNDLEHYAGNEVAMSVDFGEVAHEAMQTVENKFFAASAISVTVLGAAMGGLVVAARRSSEHYYSYLPEQQAA